MKQNFRKFGVFSDLFAKIKNRRLNSKKDKLVRIASEIVEASNENQIMLAPATERVVMIWEGDGIRYVTQVVIFREIFTPFFIKEIKN